MYPVTGPVQKITEIGVSPLRRLTRIQQRYRQTRPFNLNLPYKSLLWLSGSYTNQAYDAGTYGGSTNTPVSFDHNSDSYYAYFQSYEDATVSKAVTKFNKGQASRASLGVATVQYAEAMGMMVARTKQVLDLARALKKFDLIEASRILGLSQKETKKQHQLRRRGEKHDVKTGRSRPRKILETGGSRVTTRDRAKAFSATWLEWSFGWAPLVDDIMSAVKILDEGIPVYAAPLKAGASMSWEFTSPEVSSDQFWEYHSVGKHNVVTKASIGGVLNVTNSNYSLWSQLGFTNPALIVYEAVPFSFIANYFFNLEQYLGQFSQYDGVTVTQSWYTIVWDDTITYENYRIHKPTGQRYDNYNYVGKCVSTKRIVGSLPTVKLGMRHAYHNGVKRALNNVSLLTQLFIKRS